MLIINRYSGQAVVIKHGDKLIKVVTLGAKRQQVRIGIDAPKDINIIREELKGRRPPTEER